MDLYSPKGKRKLRAVYGAYQRVADSVYPRQIDVYLAGRRLRFQLDIRDGETRPGILLTDSNFPDPPADVETQPLDYLIDALGGRRHSD